jgi:exodeoxyribonuclease-3
MPRRKREENDNDFLLKNKKIDNDEIEASKNKKHKIEEDGTNFSEPKKTEKQLKLVSWNIAGFNSILSKGFTDYVLKEDPDILCIQETKLNSYDNEILKGYYQHFNFSIKRGYSGTAIFSKIKPINWTDGIGIKEHDNEGRVITAEFEKFYLVNAYVPNSGRKLVNLNYRQKWDKDFLNYLITLDKIKPVILCGDLNVAHQEIDLANPKSNKNKTAGFTDQERDGFSNILNSGFIDSFRHLYPDKKGVYTFWSYLKESRKKNIGWRLDYFVISKSLVEKLVDVVTRPNILGSDHCPLVLIIELKE